MGPAAKSWLAAALAITYLFAMFLAGELPRHGHYHVARGPEGLLKATPAAVRAVTLATPTLAVKLVRDGSGWAYASGIPLEAQTRAALEETLRYTHRAPPVRELEDAADEESLRSMGLSPPAISLTLEAAGGERLQLALGKANTDGALRYARRGDTGAVLLLSGFLGEAWLGLAEQLPRTQPGAARPGKRGDAAVQSGIRDP